MSSYDTEFLNTAPSVFERYTFFQLRVHVTHSEALQFRLSRNRERRQCAGQRENRGVHIVPRIGLFARRFLQSDQEEFKDRDDRRRDGIAKQESTTMGEDHAEKRSGIHWGSRPRGQRARAGRSGGGGQVADDVNGRGVFKFESRSFGHRFYWALESWRRTVWRTTANVGTKCFRRTTAAPVTNSGW